MYMFQFIVTIVRMKVLTRYGREYPLAPEPSRLYTPLHCSFRLQLGAAWTSIGGGGGGGGRNSLDPPPRSGGEVGSGLT